ENQTPQSRNIVLPVVTPSPAKSGAKPKIATSHPPTACHWRKKVMIIVETMANPSHGRSVRLWNTYSPPVRGIAEANPAYTTARNPVKTPVIKIPSQMLAPGYRMIVVMYTQGKMIPMFRMLYANAEYGDITRTSPEARRVNTWTCAVA